MKPITDRERKFFKHDIRCNLCKRTIPAGTICYMRQKFIVCKYDRVWMERNVAPDRIVREHKRKQKETKDVALYKNASGDASDIAYYNEVFDRHLAAQSANVTDIIRALLDYEGSIRDWER